MALHSKLLSSDIWLKPTLVSPERCKRFMIQKTPYPCLDKALTMQENMGHYSAAFTLDRYGHVTETMRQESANRMQAFIQGMSGNEGGK